MKIFRLSVSCALCFLTLASAQVVQDIKENTSKVTVHFIAVSAVHASVGWKTGKAWKPLLLGIGSFSTAAMPRSGSALTLYSETKNAQGQIIHQPYASAPWPVGNDDIVAILTVSRRGGAEVAALSLFPDSKQIHPEHSMRVINASHLKAALSVGEIRGVLNPGETMVAPYDPSKRKLRFNLAIPNMDDRWHLVYSTNLVPVRNHRIFSVLRSLQAEEIKDRDMVADNAGTPEMLLLYDCTTMIPPSK